ncbi:HSP20-like chaperone [Gloeophyllum trabeum ATCC 11539]|uniref:HSP20-like chaperone n=1 Tax=Gloeophyllum trabeum (strain ATCC 11539 / FP-39264 / Madison 617) TaxID=670483 RepID=S7PX09_GLOTA|nr:HSP20-like chaperone [Gloeophyllum trabeum ATCC 11539]EPQ51917.1 HSP20-like chaperone [Gloeophyllum trabeum ATCC 11539]
MIRFGYKSASPRVAVRKPRQPSTSQQLLIHKSIGAMTINSQPKKQPRMHNADHIYRLIDHALATRYVQQILPTQTAIRVSDSPPPEGQTRQAQNIMRPRMELRDTPGSPNLVATFELPGMKREEIGIEVRPGSLVVSGERKPPETNDATTFPIDELKYGPFHRALPLPRGVDASQITASMNDGLLVVSWPRSGPEDEPQRVQVG